VPDPFAEGYADLEEEEDYPEDSTIFITNTPDFDDTGFGGAAAGATNVEEQETSPADCSNLNVERRSFIVVDALLSPRNASTRLAQLKNAGIIRFRTIPTDCLNSWPSPGRHAVYLDTIFADRPSARDFADRHRTKLDKAGLDFRYGKVVKVRPRY